MSSPTRSLASFLALALLAACGQGVEAMRLSAAPLPAKPPTHPVRLYVADSPRCPVEEIGRIQAGAFSDGLRWHELWSDAVAERIRQRTRLLGGDAVVGLHEVVENLGTTISHDGKHTSDSTRREISEKTTIAPERTHLLVGSVVRFRSEECRD